MWVKRVSLTSEIRHPKSLEEILQRELHDPRILCRRHLTEDVAVEIRRWIIHEERVRDVERFGIKSRLLKGSGLLFNERF